MELSSLLRDSAPAQDPPLALHSVQFYEPHLFPAAGIAAFFVAGLSAGEAALLLATPEHACAVKDAMRQSGLDPEVLERTDLLLCWDADSVLSALKGHGTLDADRANLSPLDELLARAASSSQSGCFRVFGELVDMLAACGDFASCLRLEAHWNRLLAVYPFRLYCAYSVACFSQSSSAPSVAAVCGLHDCLVPLAGPVALPSWLAPLLQQCVAVQAEAQKLNASDNALHALELQYTRLFREHVAHLQFCLEGSLRLAPATNKPLALPPDDLLDRLVERTLREILAECQAACAACETVPLDAPESQKYIGEILAYSKLTDALCRLQQRTRGLCLH
jgi:hypothetical protein